MGLEIAIDLANHRLLHMQTKRLPRISDVSPAPSSAVFETPRATLPTPAPSPLHTRFDQMLHTPGAHWYTPREHVARTPVSDTSVRCQLFEKEQLTPDTVVSMPVSSLTDEVQSAENMSDRSTDLSSLSKISLRSSPTESLQSKNDPENISGGQMTTVHTIVNAILEEAASHVASDEQTVQSEGELETSPEKVEGDELQPESNQKPALDKAGEIKQSQSLEQDDKIDNVANNVKNSPIEDDSLQILLSHTTPEESSDEDTTAIAKDDSPLITHQTCDDMDAHSEELEYHSETEDVTETASIQPSPTSDPSHAVPETEILSGTATAAAFPAQSPFEANSSATSQPHESTLSTTPQASLRQLEIDFANISTTPSTGLAVIASPPEDIQSPELTFLSPTPISLRMSPDGPPSSRKLDFSDTASNDSSCYDEPPAPSRIENLERLLKVTVASESGLEEDDTESISVQQILQLNEADEALDQHDSEEVSEKKQTRSNNAAAQLTASVSVPNDFSLLSETRSQLRRELQNSSGNGTVCEEDSELCPCTHSTLPEPLAAEQPLRDDDQHEAEEIQDIVQAIANSPEKEGTHEPPMRPSLEDLPPACIERGESMVGESQQIELSTTTTATANILTTHNDAEDRFHFDFAQELVMDRESVMNHAVGEFEMAKETENHSNISISEIHHYPIDMLNNGTSSPGTEVSMAANASPILEDAFLGEEHDEGDQTILFDEGNQSDTTEMSMETRETYSRMVEEYLLCNERSRSIDSTKQWFTQGQETPTKRHSFFEDQTVYSQGIVEDQSIQTECSFDSSSAKSCDDTNHGEAVEVEETHLEATQSPNEVDAMFEDMNALEKIMFTSPKHVMPTESIGSDLTPDGFNIVKKQIAELPSPVTFCDSSAGNSFSSYKNAASHVSFSPGTGNIVSASAMGTKKERPSPQLTATRQLSTELVSTAATAGDRLKEMEMLAVMRETLQVCRVLRQEVEGRRRGDHWMTRTMEFGALGLAIAVIVLVLVEQRIQGVFFADVMV